MRLATLLVVTLAFTTAGQALAQSQDEFIPDRSGIILLGDRSGDLVWAMNDFDFDFTTQGAGECVPWYTGVNGPAISTIQDIAVHPSGRAYVSDSGGDQIVWLSNGNVDSDCDDPGESGVFFDLTNAGGLQFSNLFGMCVLDTPSPIVYVAVSGTSSLPDDRIFQLRDSNGDNDANDPGEARVVFNDTLSLLNGNPGLGLPTAVHVMNGRVFLLHGANTPGSATGGLYELVDLNNNGNFNDAGEVQPYYVLPSMFPGAFSMTPTRDGKLFISERGTPDAIYLLDDANGDGDVNDPGEVTTYWTPPGSSIVDDLCEYILPDGTPALLVPQDSGTDQLIMLIDYDGSGAIDAAGEEILVHDTGAAGVVDIGSPKAVEALAGPSLTGPSLVSLGQAVVANHTGVRGNTFWTGYNFTTAPIPAPPYGIYYLGTYPPLDFSVPLAIVPGNGSFDIPFTVPNLAWLSGVTIDSQSYEYDGFFGRLSQLYRITIQ